MIVGKDQARLISRGTKTTIRRPIDTTEYRPVVRRGRTEIRRPTEYRPGDRLPVKADRVSDPVCHIILTGVDRRHLGAITFQHVRAEGFRTTDEFKAHWVRLYDPMWVQRREPLAENPDGTTGRQHLDPVDLTARFDERWADAIVWVLEFEVEHDTPRLLADRHARADYVDTPARALVGEPEAIDVWRLRPVWADTAAQRRQEARGHRDVVERRRAAISRLRHADPALLDRIEAAIDDEGAAA